MEKEKILKILLLEDNKDDIVFIERALKRDGISFKSEYADTREEFHQALLKFKPDVILSDHGLPQFNSVEALKICRSEKVMAPFILVTGTVSEEFAITCLHQGADDYILKSNLSRLPTAIKNSLRQRKLEALRRGARMELRMKNRKLLKVNQELDNFVYSISHNLRAPLASVSGLLNLAKLEDKNPVLNELHRMMQESIDKLDDTLKEILDYSRSARSQVQCEEIFWYELIEKSFTKLHYLDTTSVTKKVEMIGDSTFYSDKGRLGVIFHNLLSNSILYQHPDRPPYLFIQVFVTYENATITLSDNGVGIEDSVLPHVFEMFYRGTEMSKGAGLGLYIVKEMVSKLKGKISITSIPKEGVTVTISIPNSLPRFTFFEE